MVEHRVVQRWLEDVTTSDGGRPRVLMASQPDHIIASCEAGFLRHGWVLLRVADLSLVRTAISTEVPAAAVLPLDDQEVVAGGLCSAIRDDERYMPVVAFAPEILNARARAFEAGFDAFVAHSAGIAGLCRELATLLQIAEDLGSLPARVRIRPSRPR
jgi:CheY-like chemotaxis protein